MISCKTVVHRRSLPLDLDYWGPLVKKQRCTQVIRATQTREKERPEAKSQNGNSLSASTTKLSPSTIVEISKESVVKEALRMAYRRILLELSSLPRSIIVMISIAFLSAIGTVVEQNRGVDFYIENYPDGDQKVLGFLSYPILLFLQFDHIYTAPYFYGLIALLIAQLMACTSTRQWPIAKAAQRWRFKKSPKAIAQLQNAEVLPDASIRDLGVLLSKQGYEIFLKDGSLYAFKNLVGRIAPIGVHAALLLTIAGISWGVVGGFKGTLMIPEGGDISIEQVLIPNSLLARIPNGAKKILHVDSFNIDYRSDGSISQFYSDLSITNPSGKTEMSKKISVNNPLRYNGITLYQTDWGMAAMSVTLESDALEGGKKTVRLPVASLPERQDSGNRVFATYIPLPSTSMQSITRRGISVLARDFQTVILYDSDGQFAGVRRPGSGKSIDVDGVKITIDGITGSTGLEFKSDPGVPIVYAGFASLMLTTLLSYLSHKQVWALQDGRDLHVAGKSNRSGVLFGAELSEILDTVPEAYVEA